MKRAAKTDERFPKDWRWRCQQCGQPIKGQTGCVAIVNANPFLGTVGGYPRQGSVSFVPDKTTRRLHVYTLEELVQRCPRKNVAFVVSHYEHYPFDSSGYDVAVEEISDARAMNHWVEHLCEKGWMSNIDIRNFVRLPVTHLTFHPITTPAAIAPPNALYFPKPNTADSSPEQLSMRDYVKLYRDGDNLAISTNVLEEGAFLDRIATPLAEVIGTAADSVEAHNLVNGWLPQIVDICCKLRGYKAPLVEEQRVLTAGRLGLSDSAVVASAESSSAVIARIEPQSATA